MNAIKECSIQNNLDAKGNPTGGSVNGTGVHIEWQNGPLGRGEDRQAANGAFVETVLSSALQRIQFYQDASEGRFRCRENAVAITKIEEALMWLDKRTRDREARQVEGTHKV